MKNALFALVAALFVPVVAMAQLASPRAIEIPPWFTDSFLDFREEVRDAAKAQKRVLIYFGQDGCPYCAELMRTNFSQPRIVQKTRRHFVAIALNIWGDREVTWIDGRVAAEKDFARAMMVQFTPTVLFLDEKGATVARLNGYYPPHRFEVALDYVSGRGKASQPFADYMRTAVKEAASARLHDQPFFMRAPYDLRRKPGSKPLAVIFETPYCASCDEMHRDGFTRREVQAEIARFDVVRLALGERAVLTAPGGQRMTAGEWAQSLQVTYTPSIVLFDATGQEVIRAEAYLKAFHLAGILAYVSSGAFRSQPSFQRFLQARAERMRKSGERVELWK